MDSATRFNATHTVTPNPKLGLSASAKRITVHQRQNLFSPKQSYKNATAVGLLSKMLGQHRTINKAELVSGFTAPKVSTGK